MAVATYMLEREREKVGDLLMKIIVMELIFKGHFSHKILILKHPLTGDMSS